MPKHACLQIEYINYCIPIHIFIVFARIQQDYVILYVILYSRCCYSLSSLLISVEEILVRLPTCSSVVSHWNISRFQSQIIHSSLGQSDDHTAC